MAAAVVLEVGSAGGLLDKPNRWSSYTLFGGSSLRCPLLGDGVRGPGGPRSRLLASTSAWDPGPGTGGPWVRAPGPGPGESVHLFLEGAFLLSLGISKSLACMHSPARVEFQEALIPTLCSSLIAPCAVDGSASTLEIFIWTNPVSADLTSREIRAEPRPKARGPGPGPGTRGPGPGPGARGLGPGRNAHYGLPRY